MKAQVLHSAPRREPLGSPWDRLGREGFLAELNLRQIDWPPGRDTFHVLCPVHDERTPSCSLAWKAESEPPRWVVRCFGCDFHGDGIDFLAAVDQVEPQTWLRRFRGSSNSEAPAPATPAARPKPDPEPACSQRELDAYVDRCHDRLRRGGVEGAVWRYAAGRGIRPEEARRYRLGISLRSSIDNPTLRHPDWPGRLLIPCPGGVEARRVDAGPEAKYMGARLGIDRKVPWGLDLLNHQWEGRMGRTSPLVVVEGIFDAIACRREIDGEPLNLNTIALRGKTLHPADAATLHDLGFESAYVALDSDAPMEVIQGVMDRLQAVGVRPYVVTGPEGDFGEHLTGPDEALLATFVEAVRLPEGAP